MKTKLLFTKQYSTFYFLLVFCLCFNYGWSQELVLNGTADEWTFNTGENADAWDMTPNSTIFDNSEAEIASPYQAIWNNGALEDALEIKYLGMAGSIDEQPGSTGSGNGGTRGVKLYDDGNPAITGSSRRLYQKVEGLTMGIEYTFSIDSRSEAMGTPSEVYILNVEITDEVGIDANGAGDTSVNAYAEITTDFDSWTTTTFSFTAQNTFVVIYVRSPGSVDGNTEVFYDNISLVEDATASTDDFLILNVRVYPNPAKTHINILSNRVQIENVDLYSVLGKRVFTQKTLTNNRLDVSSLAKGIYFVKINGEYGISVTKRIVIE